MRLISRATGTGAIDFSLMPGIAFQVEEVRVHLEAAGGAGNLVISFDALAGVEYDAVLDTQDMTLLADYIWQSVRPHNFAAGDGLSITWAGAGQNAYGIEVIFSGIP